MIGWPEEEGSRPSLSQAPIYYLKVRDLQNCMSYYFTLPLSEAGVDVFKNGLSGMLDGSASSNVSLTGTITNSGQLAATLTVEIDGEKVTLNTREYAIHWMSSSGKVIMWPNFVSKDWNKYYLYSEFTSDLQEQFVPIFKVEGEFVKTIDNRFWTADYSPETGEKKEVDIKKLITYPAGKGEDLHRYNIISSDKPLGGLSTFVKDLGVPTHSGYLIFRQSEVKDLSNLPPISSAVVGVDFGSNNTCVFYKELENGRGAKPIEFENYRLVLVGHENSDIQATAENNELLFFSNYPSINGQIKSWLHEQDTRYNTYQESEEIAGGVPVNRPNVFVRSMDQFAITTQAGTLHYNMKWLGDEAGMLKKKAFLKSVWLQTCAFLYWKRIKPTELVWSYPGSMMEADRTNLEMIFEELCGLTPITVCNTDLGRELVTEAEAVCSFALSLDTGLSKNNIFLGIDVGGSTSDILLLGRDPQNGNQSSLLRESSVRMAAGVFFNAVIQSNAFRDALVNFHESKVTKVFVNNINELLSEPSKAPYYLNSIFDQLQGKDYDIFYRSINDRAKFVFTIPAYVTGLLLFYSGMLIGKTIKDEKLDDVNRVDVLSFGKGGRLFHWLKNAAGRRATNDYYKACLNAGVTCLLDREMEMNYLEETVVDNKSEVAKGLVDARPLYKKEQSVTSDICGENEVEYTMPDGGIRTLSVDEELTGDYFANEMNNFNFTKLPNFEKFIKIFIDFVSQKTSLYPQAEELEEDLNELPNRVSSYVCNYDDEYRKARQNQRDGFHYHQPLIIAEGACFLETLIRRVFKR